MKLSFLGSATYEGHAPAMDKWPAPPEACDRRIASRSLLATIENSRRAVDLGFDWVSVSEHHYSPYLLTPNPIVLAGALSQAVPTATIAVLGPLIPLSNPIRIAEEIALLDSISQGRVVALPLRGTPMEQSVYRHIGDEAREMTQEGIDLILKCWTEPRPFSWHGQHFQFDTISVWPRPFSDPHPPLFGSGNSLESAAFAARRRLGLAMSFLTPESVRRTIQHYRDEAARAGWSPRADQILYRGLADLRDDECLVTAHEQADADAARGIPLPPIIHDPFFQGRPADFLRQAARLCDAGVGVLDINFAKGPVAVDYAHQALCIERFAREALPEIKRW
jgi:alkanesulfonate monooxygenase SsuD/methylene tetrahydromethanopterin reductase-like flavin-dependent oxidoreductase (luciferase family)